MSPNPVIRDGQGDLASDCSRSQGLKSLHKICRTLPETEITNLQQPPDPATLVPLPDKIDSCIRSTVRAAVRSNSQQVTPAEPPPPEEVPSAPTPPDPPPPEIPPPTIEYSSCNETVTITWGSIAEASSWKVEISDSEEGPWTQYILINDGSVTYVKMGNYFGGTKWLRFNVGYTVSGTLYFAPFEAFSPAAPQVLPPVFLGINNTAASGSPMRFLAPSGVDGASVSVVSARENPLIGLDDTYVEVHARREYVSDRFNFDGIPVFASFAAPGVGSTVRFTVDNTSPTIGTVNPPGNQINPFSESFSHILRARCEDGVCLSPEVVVLVDKRTPEKPLLSFTLKGGAHSGVCDLPSDWFTYFTFCNTPGDTSGASCCKVSHPEGLPGLVRDLACFDQSLFGSLTEYMRYSVLSQLGVPGSFFPEFRVLFSIGTFRDIVYSRTSSYWDLFPAGVFYAFRVFIPGLPDPFGLEERPDFENRIPVPGNSFTGPAGDPNDLKNRVRNFFDSITPPCGAFSGLGAGYSMTCTGFDIITSRDDLTHFSTLSA